MTVTIEADILAEYTRSDGRRQWTDVGTWLYPGDVIAHMDDPRMVGHWYVLDVLGVATLCADEADARRVRSEHEALYPGRSPHRGVRLAVAAEIDREVAQSVEPRPHSPGGAGSRPALATTQEQAT